MKRILANAVVDVKRDPTPKVLGHFRVEVWGHELHDYVRHYEIQAKSDTMAAQEGIRRFVEEMEHAGPKEE